MNIALLAGNEIYSIDLPDTENKNLLVWMHDPITIQVKKQIDEECYTLRHWQWHGVPHDPADEGYTCDVCNVVLIF